MKQMAKIKITKIEQKKTLKIELSKDLVDAIEKEISTFEKNSKGSILLNYDDFFNGLLKSLKDINMSIATETITNNDIQTEH